MMSMANKLESPSAERNRGPIWELVIRDRLLRDVNATDASTTASSVNVLEVAAGAGVHTQYFTQQLADRKIPVNWQSTDPETSALKSQEAYIEEIAGITSKNEGSQPCWRNYETVNFAKPLPLTLDENGICETTTESAIEDQSIDWIWNINMIHISPWTATQGLMKMAGTKLKPKSGRLILYGPYRVNGYTVESNLCVTKFPSHIVVRFRSLSFRFPSFSLLTFLKLIILDRKFEEWLKAKDPSYGVRNLEDVVAEASKYGLEVEDTIEMPANNLSVILRKKN